jgi:dynein heavy chain
LCSDTLLFTEELSEFIRTTNGKVSREVKDLDSLSFIMDLLNKVRKRESSMEMEINPIMDMYRMLESYLPPGMLSTHLPVMWLVSHNLISI